MLTKELDIAQKLSKEAAHMILDFYDCGFEVEFKGKNNPVTQADKAANEFITSELEKSFPNDAILAEESKDDFRRLEKRRVWLVDPLDGTKEFISKNGEFCVMIGLVEECRPILGVVYQPTTDLLYSAIKNKGASLIRNGDASALAVSKISEVSKMRLVISRSHREPVVDEIKEVLGIKEEVSSGSVGLKVGLLVRSKCDLYIHPSGQTKEWDTCAPEIILEEAGGKMTDCWGQHLKYNKHKISNSKGFIATNGQLHSEITSNLSPFLNHIQ